MTPNVRNKSRRFSRHHSTRSVRTRWDNFWKRQTMWLHRLIPNVFFHLTSCLSALCFDKALQEGGDVSHLLFNGDEHRCKVVPGFARHLASQVAGGMKNLSVEDLRKINWAFCTISNAKATRN